MTDIFHLQRFASAYTDEESSGEQQDNCWVYDTMYTNGGWFWISSSEGFSTEGYMFHLYSQPIEPPEQFYDDE